MFGLSQQIKLKQAKNALRDGRIDEAWAIATEREIREHRRGQVLLEKLVNPLLDRASHHLAEGRLRDALVDVERALDAGGNRPRAAALRQQIRDAMEAREKMVRKGRELIESAQDHLQRGSLHAGRELLERAPSGEPGVSQLRRLAENRERRGNEAARRVEACLSAGDLQEALEAAAGAVQAYGRRDGLGDLLPRLRKSATEKMERAMNEGQLRTAAGLSERLRGLFGEHLEIRRFDDAIGYTRRAATALQQGDYEEARVALGRLERVLPKARWVGETLEELDRVTRSLRALATGPLGLFQSVRPRRDGREIRDSASSTETLSMPMKTTEEPERRPEVLTSNRLLLWVDGVGTYLILTSDRTTIGRTGSSARPHLSLAANIQGHHAEILRVEDDYFAVAAQGELRVGGKETRRHLLASGDELDLGHHCRLTFQLPTALSNTAVLTLRKGLRVERDVRDVILLDRELLVGSRSDCHVRAPVKGEPIVISIRKGGLHCRANQEILVDGRESGEEASIPSGAHVRIGELSFTITTADGKER